MQTGALVGDFDGDGVNDFILSFRQKPPALVWYRRVASGWTPCVIEREYLTIEAGGAAHDIDGDGDLDVVFGGDWQSGQVWWWENPSPRFEEGGSERKGLDGGTSWRRRPIKKDGETQHHDQAFGDFLGAGRAQLAFWNQRAKTIFLAQIPEDPDGADGWPLTPIFAGGGGDATLAYPEGMSTHDVDADGKVDLLAANTWFKHSGGTEFRAVRFAEVGGLLFAGYFKPTRYPQIVVSPGDGVGPLRWYECIGSPEEPKDWVGHDLLDRRVVHGHTLQLGDVDRDGRLDIFAAEMAKWRERESRPDHGGATAWIFFGDGKGGFARTEVVRGHGWHEGRLSDLDGDGDLDLLNKPYTWETPRVDVWLQGGTRPGARGVGTTRSFPGPVGLQLYSLRDVCGRNVPLGLQIARSFGFVEVELAGTYGLPPGEFRSLLDIHGLKPIAGHWSYEEWAKDPEATAGVAEALGIPYAGCAWIPHQGAFTEKDARDAVATFNRAGEALARRGMKFFYHNHGYEFVPHGDGTLFDLLVEETKAELVSFEMDVFWTVHPGQDPVKLLEKHPKRWELFHIKDMREGTRTGLLTGSEDVRNDVAVGTGQIDIRAVLREAVRFGVRHYFIEDESPAVIEQIPQSVRFLESLQW
jgi:sugar phosphate isomerase/epimerase